MKELLLGTNNKGKVEEMEDILKHLGIQLLTPEMIGLNLEVSEDGDTYEENATLKATAFSKASNLPCLADDSGLEVDALDGSPGLHSHRFSPQPGATDADRRAFLLKKLQRKPRPWKAHFHATIVLVHPDGRVRTSEGECRGEIIPEERGSNGFGYDPIFYIPSLGRTMAELEMEKKNQVSHRANALRNAEAAIREILDL
ncbi:MAG: RdgB/HAM1 family non-canonical purine NTP pyrophosphatase [Anaerolineales bacterium]